MNTNAHEDNGEARTSNTEGMRSPNDKGIVTLASSRFRISSFGLSSSFVIRTSSFE